MSAYEKFLDLVGHHTVQIYGDYGTGKSRFVHSIAKETQALGRKVLYLDTEGSLSDSHVKELLNYEYLGDDLEKLVKRVEKAKVERDKFDLLIIDSIGLPVLNAYARWRLDKKLGAIQKLAPIMADTVRFARDGNGLSIVTNQCVSEFSRVSKHLPPDEPLAPFGGKISFVPKLILRSEPLIRNVQRSEFRLLVFKARDLPRNFEVARFTIDADGVKIAWRDYREGAEKPQRAPPARVVPEKAPPGPTPAEEAIYDALEKAGLDPAPLNVYLYGKRVYVEIKGDLGDKVDLYKEALSGLGAEWRSVGPYGRWEIPPGEAQRR